MQRYENSVLYQGQEYLRVAPGAEIYVYEAGTLTPAAIYETNDHAPLVNPFVADDQGTFFFYAEDGRYDIRVVAAGRPEQWSRDVLLEDIDALGAVTLPEISRQDGEVDEAAAWVALVPSIGKPNGLGDLNLQAKVFDARTKANKGRLDSLGNNTDPSKGANEVGFVQDVPDPQSLTAADKLKQIIHASDSASAYDPDSDDPFKGSLTYGGWTTLAPRHGLYTKFGPEYGSIKATPADAEELPEYPFRIPYMQTHPGDIYPSMGLGYKQDWPKGMRSTHIGYWTGAGGYQVDSSLNPADAFTPLARHYGLTTEPMAWSTLVGERAGRLAGDFAPTMVGQQAGLNALGYSSNFFGRQAGQYSRGIYNLAYGNNAADHLFGERNMAFGQEAGLQSATTRTVMFGHRAGANSALTDCVAVGYLSMQTGTGTSNTALGSRAAQNLHGDHNTAIGNQASVSVAESGLAFTVDAEGVDIPNNRFLMPPGTAATLGLSDGEYFRLDWNGSGLTRAPTAYKGSSSAVFKLVLDGTDEWFYASQVDTGSGYEVETAPKLYWALSSQNDSVPASNRAPTVWDADTEYSTRDTVTTPNAPGEVFLWIRTQDQSPDTAPEPTVGDGWEDYWVQTEPGSGSITFTPYRKVSSATAVGSLASARFENSTALGRGATTTKQNQVVIGNSSVTEVRIPQAASYNIGAVLWKTGTGSPEGVVSAPVGSLYSRTDGGATTTLYVKESGAGNTGWVAK